MLVHTDEPKSISAGYDHSLILKQDGSVWVTGWNGNGQLGDGTTTDKYTFEDVIGQYETIAYNISMRRPALLPLAITHTHWYIYGLDSRLNDMTHTHRIFAFMMYRQ